MFKWAQLDLARQMESVDFIKEFMATMAKAGYNGILLYLEDNALMTDAKALEMIKQAGMDKYLSE